MRTARRALVLGVLDVAAVLVGLWIISVASRVLNGPWVMSGQALVTLLVAFELVAAIRRGLAWLVAGVATWFAE